MTERPDILALAEALRPGVMRLARRLRQEAQKAGLSIQDVTLLALIRRQPGVGVSALADAEQTSRPTMSEHVKRLEAAGLVRRAADESDGRRSGLQLTAAGVRKLDQIRAQRNDWLAARLAALDPEARERLAGAAEALLTLSEAEP